MSYAQMRGKNIYVNPSTGQGLYFSTNEKQLTAFNHEQLTIINLISNGLAKLTSLIVSGITTLSSLTVSNGVTATNLTIDDSATINDLIVSNSTTLNDLTASNLTINNSATINDLIVSNSTTLNDLTASNLTIDDSATINELIVSNSTTLNDLTASNLTIDDSATLNELIVSNSTTLNDLTASNLTISNSLTFGTYNLYFGIATLSPTDTTSYPAYISNPGYGDGHGNSNYTITQSVNTIVGCVINPINSSRFFITYVSQTSSNQIYVSWVNLTNGSYSLPTNVSYIIWGY